MAPTMHGTNVLPPQINYVTWSPDSKTIAFTLRRCAAALAILVFVASSACTRRWLPAWCCRLPALECMLPAPTGTQQPCRICAATCTCSAGGDENPPREPLELWVADMATGKARRLLGHRLNSTFEE